MKSELLLACALAGIMTSTHAAESKTKEAPKDEIMGQCLGVNSCKGQSACHGKNECAGMNECKGKGWVSKTEKECKSLKGTWKKN